MFRKLLCMTFVLVIICLPDINASGENLQQKQIKILFIGNSYTASVPFKDLVKRIKKNALVVDASEGYWTLEQHTACKKKIDKIRSENWDYVSLQERSTIPSRYGYGRRYFSAKKLDNEIKKKGGKTLFFMPWAYRYGDPNFSRDTFLTMLKRIEKNYFTTAKHLSAKVVPVGWAFEKAIRERPNMKLMSEDGTHAEARGGYLAAYVFYAVIFNESPKDIPGGQFSPEDEQFLKRIAHETIFGK